MTKPLIVRDPVVDMDTWRRCTNEQRRELLDLRDRHTDIRRVFRFEYDLIDCPILRISYYVSLDGGRTSTLDPDCRCGEDGRAVHLWTRDAEFALREPLPDWWQPGTVNLTKENL